ncbi:DUF4783 domain-containing protein [Daejeonella sp.]|uniref:DUF4783 domain-containing protein n=1 Tax=Daejeonella sp. TaxID=2805397 RepID=UPI0030C2FC56
MRTKLLMILVSLLMGVSDLQAQQADIVDAFAKYFRTSDAGKMSDEFSSTLQLNILSEENVYSKAQAEQIMRDFFSKNKPTSVKIVHRLRSNPNYKIAVLSMLTAKDKFRISISYSGSGTRFLIKEMRIEYDKQ